MSTLGGERHKFKFFIRTSVIIFTLILAANILVACGSGSSNPRYSIGGTISGLEGSGLILQNNGGDDLEITADGDFTFETELDDEEVYAVTVSVQPSGPTQTCTVTNGSGTVDGADVTNVTVECTTNTYTIGGTVSGLDGTGLVLQNNAGDDLGISADGDLTFTTLVASGATYAVTVLTQPRVLSQTCTVTNYTGTVTNSNITNVTVTCVTPPPRFAYVSHWSSDSGISAYAIDADTGFLTPITATLATGSPRVGIVADPTDKFVYLASYSVNFVSAYEIDSVTGALTEITSSPFAAGTNPVGVAVDSTGKFVYVANGGSNNISAYTLDADTGALTPITGSPFAAESAPSFVAVEPTGKFAYVTNYYSNNISAYKIDSVTGALSPITGSPFAAGAGPFGVAVDPTGKFIYVSNRNSTTVSAYTIDAAGALTEITGSPFTVGNNPWDVTVDPRGKFVYVTNYNSNNVSAYTIDTSTGALTPITGSPFAVGLMNPYGVTVDPTGQFVYVANAGDNTISAYTIDAATGALSPITGSPFAAQVGISLIAITR